MKTTLYILALMLITSCYTKKQAVRKFCTETTVTIHDTVIVPEIKADTVFSVEFDTIRIERERLRVQVIRLLDSVYVNAECKSDTIYRTHTVSVPCPKPVFGFKALWANRSYTFYVMFMAFILGVCLGLYFRR